jgi:hypothetical protein
MLGTPEKETVGVLVVLDQPLGLCQRDLLLTEQSVHAVSTLVLDYIIRDGRFRERHGNTRGDLWERKGAKRCCHCMYSKNNDDEANMRTEQIIVRQKTCATTKKRDDGGRWPPLC